MQYEEVVKMIEDSEKRVDEVLKAAKLDRHERQPMSKERLEMILNCIMGCFGMTFVFIAFMAFMYFMTR